MASTLYISSCRPILGDHVLPKTWKAHHRKFSCIPTCPALCLRVCKRKEPNKVSPRAQRWIVPSARLYTLEADDDISTLSGRQKQSIDGQKLSYLLSWMFWAQTTGHVMPYKAFRHNISFLIIKINRVDENSFTIFHPTPFLSNAI